MAKEYWIGRRKVETVFDPRTLEGLGKCPKHEWAWDDGGECLRCGKVVRIVAYRDGNGTVERVREA